MAFDLNRIYSESGTNPAVVNKLKAKFKFIREGELLFHYLICNKDESEAESHIEKCQLWRQITFPLTSIDNCDEVVHAWLR